MPPDLDELSTFMGTLLLDLSNYAQGEGQNGTADVKMGKTARLEGVCLAQPPNMQKQIERLRLPRYNNRRLEIEIEPVGNCVLHLYDEAETSD